MSDWIIYGANGYTGELIAREAVRRGREPLLAGRSAEAIEPLARELGLPSRVFDLSRPDLRGARLVLHCAGPFSRTSRPMVDACLHAGVHYLDITGEVDVFESIFARDAEAKAAGVTLLPGVGFDVVPTDCLAAMLAERLPDADELWLAFYTQGGGVSPGTLKTALEGGTRGGMIRRDGKLVRVPLLYDVRPIPFSCGERLAVTIPWGDLATAYRTTGIPNIRVYAARSRRAIRWLRSVAALSPVLRVPFVLPLAQRLAARHSGPSDAQRAAARVHLWGRAADSRSEVTMTMTVAEGYTFTVRSALFAVERLLGGAAQPGVFTPSQLLGAGIVREIAGTELPHSTDI